MKLVAVIGCFLVAWAMADLAHDGSITRSLPAWADWFAAACWAINGIAIALQYRLVPR